MRLPGRITARQIGWLGLLLLAALAGYFILSSEKAPIPESMPRILVKAETIKVRSEPISISREVTGIVTSLHESTLASKVVGLVEEIRVREGDSVKAGSLLVRLDNRDLQAQLARAEAELENAALQLERMKELYAGESVAKQELDNAERTFRVARATRETILANLAYTSIEAPFSGVITEKYIELGELATPGRPLLRLVDPSRLRLETTVPETDIAALATGEEVEVRLDAIGDEPITATVTQIIPSADPATHSFLVRAELPPLPGLKRGLFGRMSFTVGKRSGILLPKEAVHRAGELTRVYVADAGDVIRSRLVKLGKDHQNRVEVLSGLVPGERVLARADQGVEGALLTPPSDQRDE